MGEMDDVEYTFLNEWDRRPMPMNISVKRQRTLKLTRATVWRVEPSILILELPPYFPTQLGPRRASAQKKKQDIGIFLQLP